MSELSLPRPKIRRHRSELSKALATQRDVLWALILHDIKSRFFGNGLGYIVTILWPAAHIALILSIYVIGKRPIPYGTSGLLYASTGALPYIAWNYMARFTMMGMLTNRSFMAYPIVKPLDMMFARLALESVTVFIITVGLIGVNVLVQVDVMPLNLSGAVCGLLSAVLLGIGFGILNAVIVMIFPLWGIGYVLVVLSMYFTSGMIFNPETMPAQIGYYVSFNPLMHSIEWIRQSYYADFPGHLLDKSYVIEVGVGSLAVGLLMERSLKRYFKI